MWKIAGLAAEGILSVGARFCASTRGSGRGRGSHPVCGSHTLTGIYNNPNVNEKVTVK